MKNFKNQSFHEKPSNNIKKPIFSLKKPSKNLQKTNISTKPIESPSENPKKQKNLEKTTTMFWRSSAIPHHQAEDLQNIVFFGFFGFFGFLKVFQWILLKYLFFEGFLIDFAEILVYSIDFDEILAPEVGGQP